MKGFTWHEHSRLALLNLVYGHMPFERWFEVRGGRTHLAGVQERQPHTIAMIDVADDGYLRQVMQNTQDVPIPANRLTWYANEREGANWAGVSLLRPCYTPWILKHEVMRVHATAIRRFGMGVPGVEAPTGATPAQIEQARQLASGMRVGDTSGAGMPGGFKFTLTGLTGLVPDAVAFLAFLNQEMTGSALAQIVELGTTAHGSRAVGESFLDLFLLSLQAAADAIGATATIGDPAMPGLARSLVEFNLGEGEPVPRIVANDIGDRHEVTAAAINLLVQSGALVPDEGLDAFIRDAWGLPERTEPSPPVPVPGQPPAEPGVPPSPPLPEGSDQPQSAGGVAARAGGRRHRHAAAAPGRAGGLRRQLTPAEAASGAEFESMRDDLQSLTDRLAGRWASVLRAQRSDLADQVTAAVDDLDLARLASLAAPEAGGPDLLAAAMIDAAHEAVRRMAAEAATQGVSIDPARVAVDEARLIKIAQARAGLAGAYIAQQACCRALHMAGADIPGGQVAREVTITLEGLSPTPLADQLMAAMMAAQNAGRVAALDEAPDATYVATEILDVNTCPPCLEIDGTQFASLAEADATYASGGYVACDGELRCRGTVIATWPDLTVTAPGEQG